MGIFDKKGKGRTPEDFDSPVERIDLNSQVRAEADSTVDKAQDPEESAGAAEDDEAANPPARAQPRESSPPPRKHQDYGIEEAIALMRTLPMESVELVVRVVKQTLESTNIDIPLIIEDATAKQKRIHDRVEVLKSEITDLEKEIAQRSDEISALEKDNEETSMVKDRLELAEKLGKRSSGSPSMAPPLRGPKRATLPPVKTEKSAPVMSKK